MRIAVVVGFDYHAALFCKKTNAYATSWHFDYYPSTRVGIVQAFLRIRDADALIRFGGPAPHPILMAAARARKIPIIVIWAGTDVSLLLERPYKVSQVLRAEITHLAVAPWLADELKQAGIAAQYIPIIGMNPNYGSDIPKGEFSVLSYLPEPRRDFYGRQHVYDVARRLPDVNFLIVGPGSPDGNAPPNTSFLGLLPDITSIIDRCAALLRVPDHDGMSLVVLEALSRGRFVAWKYDLPGVQQVATSNDTVKFLSTLRAQLASDGAQSNTLGINFIATRYDEREVALGVERLLNQIVDARHRLTADSRQVVVFGLDIFVADLANLNNQTITGWNAEVLQLETKYEAFGALLNLAKSDVIYTVGAPALGRAANFVANITRKPRVMHWVGTDIEVARRNPKLSRRLNRPLITHLAEVEWEADELRSIGIHAQIVPLPPRLSGPVSLTPLPSEFTLLTYLPRVRADFYGRRELEFIMRSFCNEPIKFLIVGGGAIDVPPGVNADNLGWCYSLTEVYARSSALFRFTPRDGLSLMVLEALSFGRHVLWTQSFPFVTQVLSVEGAIDALNYLLDRFQKGRLAPQADAAEFVRTAYDRKRCISRIAGVWDSAVRHKSDDSARGALE